MTEGCADSTLQQYVHRLHNTKYLSTTSTQKFVEVQGATPAVEPTRGNWWVGMTKYTLKE